MVATNDLMSLLQRFVQDIRYHLPIREVYLFGSYASGEANEDSDIDVAIVADGFRGIRYFDRQVIHHIIKKDLLKVYYNLEIHPFKTEDFTPDNPFVEEILRTGKRIQWN